MSRPLRVLTITPDFPPAVGGIQLLVHRVLTHFTRIESRVVTIGPADPERSQEEPQHVVRVRRAQSHRLEVSVMNMLAIREAYRFRPDLVFAAHIVAGPAAAAIGRRFGVPSVLYVYGKEVGASPGVARFAVRNRDAIIAISRYARSLALEAGAPEAVIHVIPPGVDLIEPGNNSRREQPTILTVARLEDRYKGHDMLVRALPLIRARVPGVEWVVIGDGQLRRDTAELADAYGIADSILMLGSVPDAERNAWLDRAHVFAMPSRLPAGKAAGEGFGIVYLEAGVHGLPVVAGNVGGAVDAVLPGETGLLVDPTSSLAIADAITELLLDDARARRMGKAGKAWARRFDWPLIASQVEDLLLSVAGR